MKKTIKKALQNFFKFFGFKISKIDKRQVSEANRLNWLRDMHIKTVIDVGASKGNASLQFHELFPDAYIYAFEPLRDCFECMNEKLQGIKNFKSFNVALSDSKGQQTIHRSSYSGSSSLRKMSEIHKTAFPVTAGEREQTIETDTMDSVLSQFELEPNILVKIDVQGFEEKVIAGGKNTLSRAKVVIIETSFAELYKGQPLFDTIFGLLQGMGFRYAGAWEPDLKSPLNGISLQQDSIFLKQ